MSRKLKNIIMIVLIIALSIALFFKINYPRNQFEKNDMSGEMNFNENRPGNMGEGGPPEIPTTNGNTTTEPPTMPEGDVGEIPEMPTGEENNMGERPTRPEGEGVLQGEMSEGMNRGFGRINTTQIILCGIEGLGISLLLIYLIMSKFNKLTLKETFGSASKIIIYIALAIVITAGIIILIMNLTRNNQMMGNRGMPQEETAEKQTTAEDVDSGKSVNEEKIILNEQTSNITITEAGTYTLSGEFGYSVLINADGEVTLNLDNVTITNNTTATIANISTNPLIINLPENTTSTLTDGGASEYDSCIYSMGALTITGTGTLNIFGKQEDSEGIATETNDITINGGNINIESIDDGLNAGGDGGTITINDGTIYIKASGDGIDSNKNIIINGGSVYAIGSSQGGDAGMDADQGITINGGTVIALGSDMLEEPLSDSSQKSLCFNLNTPVKSGSSIVLKDSNSAEIASFTADENFKTLIISNDKITSGKYLLYNGEEKISEIEK